MSRCSSASRAATGAYASRVADGGEQVLVLDGVVHREEPADLLAQPRHLLRRQRGGQPVQVLADGTHVERALAELGDGHRELGQLLAEVVVDHPQVVTGVTLPRSQVHLPGHAGAGGVVDRHDGEPTGVPGR